MFVINRQFWIMARQLLKIKFIIIVWLILFLGFTLVYWKQELSSTPGRYLAKDKSIVPLHGIVKSNIYGHLHGWLKYQPNLNVNRFGQHFGIPLISKYLKRLGLDGRHYLDINELPEKPTIVLPVSQTKFKESLGAIASVQNYLSNYKFVVFDIGLSPAQVIVLQKMCGVQYRKFDFRFFPKFVTNLKHFHWKPLLFQIALKDYGSILWIEASTRIVTSDIQFAVKEALKSGIKLFGRRHRSSTYSVTNPGMYRWLPSDYNPLRRMSHYQTAPLIAFNTAQVQSRFSLWFCLCALNEKCLAPISSKRRCLSKLNRRTLLPQQIGYLKCHKFDQSAANILLKNMFNYRASQFYCNKTFSYLSRKSPKSVKFCH